MVARSFFHPFVQDDIRTRSTLHFEGRNGGIDSYYILVCLTIWHLDTNVQRRKASTCSTEVFLGQARHARGIIPHIGTIVS